MLLDELIEKTLAIIKTRNYAENTWKHHFRNGRFSSIRQYFAERNAIDFDVGIANEYIASLKKRYENNEISYSRHAHLKKLAVWLIEVYLTGNLPQSDSRRSKIVVNRYLEDILQDYLNATKEARGSSIIARQKSITLHFMDFLHQEKGYNNFSTLSLKDIHDFIFFTRQRVKGRIDAVVHEVKRFLIYLRENNIIGLDLTPALYMKPPVDRKLLARFTQDEVDKIIAQPDRDTPIGKRDYAILLLGSSTGLRIGDIINLKLSDIHWKRDEIVLMQGKTVQLLVLPLEADVGFAIIDYIKISRPKCNSPYLFLRHNAPHDALSQQLVTTLFTRYRSAAGIPHTAGDGKSFHGLRRTIASRMLEADIPLTTISQILGHRHMDSAKPYLSIDEKNLAKCSLPLTGIEVTKEALK